MKPVLIILIVLGGLSFFVFLWCGIIYSIGYLSGWQKLSQYYSTTNTPDRMKSCSCLFRQTSRYNEVVQYAATPKGLYLKTINLFSVGHKPLFIPWQDMERYESGHLTTPYKHRFMVYKARFSVKGVTIAIDQDVRAMQTHN